MNRSSIQIGDLRLRAPGLTPEQAQRLGRTVARRLAELQPNAGRRINALALRVRSDAGVSVDRLADEIVSGIRRSLK